MSSTDVSKERNGGIDPLALQQNLALDGESEKRLHDLLNSLPAAVYTTDAELQHPTRQCERPVHPAGSPSTSR